jgi:hypothetical protein
MTIADVISSALPVSGHQYPAPAAIKVEAYWWHLTALREAATRTAATAHLHSLASVADQVAAALTGTPEATSDTALDPLAWTDTATYLTLLALALHSAQTGPADKWETSDGDAPDWENLAAATTRREFAAAWHPIRENLIGLTTLPGKCGADPQLRTFTVAQVIRAAAALIDAPW